MLGILGFLITGPKPINTLTIRLKIETDINWASFGLSLHAYIFENIFSGMSNVSQGLNEQCLPLQADSYHPASSVLSVVCHLMLMHPCIDLYHNIIRLASILKIALKMCVVLP